MAGQAKVDPELFGEYRWSGSTIEYRQARIRDFNGFRVAAVGDEDKLIVWLAADICPMEPAEPGTASGHRLPRLRLDA